MWHTYLPFLEINRCSGSRDCLRRNASRKARSLKKYLFWYFLSNNLKSRQCCRRPSSAIDNRQKRPTGFSCPSFCLQIYGGRLCSAGPDYSISSACHWGRSTWRVRYAIQNRRCQNWWKGNLTCFSQHWNLLFSQFSYTRHDCFEIANLKPITLPL